MAKSLKELKEELEALDRFYFAPMRVKGLFRDEEIIKNGITIQEIVKKLGNELVVFGKFDEKDIPELKEALVNNKSYFSDFEFEGDLFRLKKFKPYTHIIKTSGKIIVENDLREFFERPPGYDLNSVQGLINQTHWYARQGMCHGFVGNSCPTLYLSEKHGKILIGVDYDRETDEMNPTPILPDDSYKELCSVITDLWWYSIMDYDEFVARNPDVNVNALTVVDIPAGNWKLEHKYGISELGYHENLPYATLTKI